ncbi:uncharacterized protein PD653_2326 [Nocardioides sp. PD653]|nr:uncharacterized protein PD653B2_3891 [Nocardioides sp. PD653-B2]GAW54911.1 uncharacterized protein PD653_2326 [Nocardioides sp. PD653]
MQLAADAGRRLEQEDVVAGGDQVAGGGQAREAAPDHHDALAHAPTVPDVRTGPRRRAGTGTVGVASQMA